MFYQVIGFFFFFEPKQQIVESKIGSTSLSQKTLDRHKFGQRNYDPIIFFNSEVKEPKVCWTSIFRPKVM